MARERSVVGPPAVPGRLERDALHPNGHHKRWERQDDERSEHASPGRAFAELLIRLQELDRVGATMREMQIVETVR